MKKPIRILFAFACLAPVSTWACAACYGQSDAPMARGMNWGIVSLLGVIVSVLSGVAGFFVYLAHRSPSVSPTATAEPLLQPSHATAK
jgi:hypothetical protein